MEIIFFKVKVTSGYLTSTVDGTNAVSAYALNNPQSCCYSNKAAHSQKKAQRL